MKKIIWKMTVILLGAALFWGISRPQQPVRASVFWASANGIPDITLGVRHNPITVCFVGDAVMSRPARVQEVVTHLQEFVYAANIDFETTNGLPLAQAAQNNIASLQCPAPTQQGNGWDYYDGDIRVMLRYTSVGWYNPTPGVGCYNDAMVGEPDATRREPGRIDVFWRGANDVLRHRVWTYNGNIWDKSPLEELGGILTSGPGVASWDTGKLSVLARGQNGGLWHLRYDGNWGSWQSIGGTITGSPDAVSWGTNRLDVFVRWNDNSLRHIWSTDGGQTWTNWEDLGGVLTSGPTAVSWASNRLVVLARGQDNSLWYRRYDGSAWSGWQTLGGSLAGAPDATSWGNNRIDVAVRWTDGTFRQLTSTDGGLTWGSWQNWGGSLNSDPTIVADSPNRLQVYYQGANTSLWQRLWDNNNGVWAGAFDQGVNGNDGSYSGPPWEANTPNRRACMFNLKLGDDHGPGGPPYLNHTLHEFGHALGLSHEHERFDGDPNCGTGGTHNGLMTPYDRDSVMHYQRKPPDWPNCNPPIDGNYGYSGLSYWDRLGLHILYPEDNRVAEFVGTTVLRTGESLNLQSAWLAQGANVDVVASNFTWHINDDTLSGPTLTYDLPGAGEYPFDFSYDDLLGRDYHYSGVVRVLDPGDFDAQIVAPIMTSLPLMYPNNVYIPTVEATIQPDEYMTFLLPSGLFSDTVIIDYSALPVMETQGKQNIGIFYELNATYLANGQPAQILPGQTYSVEATYPDTAVSPDMNEADLSFYFWEPEYIPHPGPPYWVPEPSSTVDVAANQVSAAPDHFSFWAVLDRNKLYLPTIIRP